MSERMDTYLLSMIEAAEAGSPTPGINVVTSGGDWIQGTPCSTEYFRHVTWNHYVQELDKQLRKTHRRERKANPKLAESEAVQPYAAVAPKRGAEPSPVLNLVNATLSFGGRGDGMKLPTVRIPVNAITSWWIAGGSYIKPQSSGGGFVGGVVFPVGN